MSNLNKIMRHRNRDESQFRVHFYIKYVYFDSDLQPEQFLQAIAFRLSKILPVAHLQIITPIKRLVDISVGLQNDLSAFNFIESGGRILLQSETGNQVEHDIIISDAFKTFYKAKKQGKVGNNQGKRVYKHQKSSSESPLERKKDREVLLKKNRKKQQDDDAKTNFLWIFCIPFDCKEREVTSALGQKNIRVKSFEWKLKEDMEYMQVELLQPLNLRDLQFLDCKIQKYPILVLPRLQDPNNVYQHILKHQIELNFQKDIDEVQLINLVQKIGGVLCLVKDQFYGPRKYVVGLNCSSKIDVLVKDVQKRYKNCHCQRPKYPIRLGRMEKNFTFAQIVENLMAYQEQM